MANISLTSNPRIELDSDAIRSYEDAATAIGRLDATAALAPSSLRELLVVRCIANPFAADTNGMIALVQADGEGEAPIDRQALALRSGATRARGGARPTAASIYEATATAPRVPADDSVIVRLDELIRDSHERVPPLLKAAHAASLVAEWPDPAAAAALTVTLVLCVGGAITDAWLTLPSIPSADSPARPTTGRTALSHTLTLLAREARAAVRAVAAARALLDEDETRVRAALGRAAYSALDVLRLLSGRLTLSVQDASKELGLTPPTAGAAMARLVEFGIAREITGRARSRVFAYHELVRAFEPRFDR